MRSYPFHPPAHHTSGAAFECLEPEGARDSPLPVLHHAGLVDETVQEIGRQRPRRVVTHGDERFEVDASGLQQPVMDAGPFVRGDTVPPPWTRQHLLELPRARDPVLPRVIADL